MKMMDVAGRECVEERERECEEHECEFENKTADVHFLRCSGGINASCYGVSLRARATRHTAVAFKLKALAL